MKKALFSSLVVAIAAVSANAIPITIALSAAPSADPGAAALGLYLPNEVVQVTASLSAASDIPFIGLIQVDYSNSGTSIIDYNSDACVGPMPPTMCAPLPAALALVVNPMNNPIYARITADIPSAAVIPAAGGGFITFNAMASPLFDTTVVVDVLGPSDPGDATGAFITTDDFGFTWDNGLPVSATTDLILGGLVSLTTIVPEPTSLVLLALGAIAAIRRRVA